MRIHRFATSQPFASLPASFLRLPCGFHAVAVDWVSRVSSESGCPAAPSNWWPPSFGERTGSPKTDRERPGVPTYSKLSTRGLRLRWLALDSPNSLPRALRGFGSQAFWRILNDSVSIPCHLFRGPGLGHGLRATCLINHPS